MADFFSILLLGLEKVEMIRRSSSVTDCQAMANGLGEIGLAGLNGVVHGFASCEMRRNCRGECAAGAMRVGGIDEFPLEHIEEPAVIKQIGGSLCRQMTALDQHMFAAEPVNDFGRAASVGERLDLDTGQLLGLMDVRRDEQRQGEELCLHGVDCLRLEQRMAGL